MTHPMTEGKRGPGRPFEPDPKTETLRVRVTPQQREKFEGLGGADWLRRKVDRAKPTNDKRAT